METGFFSIIDKLERYLFLLHCLRYFPCVFAVDRTDISQREPAVYYPSEPYQTVGYTFVVDICHCNTADADLVAIEAIVRPEEGVKLTILATQEGNYEVDLGNQKEIIDFERRQEGWKRLYFAVCWRENHVELCDFDEDTCRKVEIKELTKKPENNLQNSLLAASVRKVSYVANCIPYSELKDFINTNFPFPSNSDCGESFPMRVPRRLICHSSCATCSDSTFTGCLSCSPGFVISATSCLPCDPTCQTCQLPNDSSKCLSCVGTATITSPPAACICPSGTYWSTSPYQCNSCASICLACSGSATTCTSCQAHATLNSGVCMCDLFYFSDPDASLCSACQSTCKSCLNADECVDCVSPAIWFFADKLCYCSEAHYTLTTPRQCLPCYSTCFSCFAGLISDCKSCWMNAELANGGPRAACKCISAFYPDPDAANCQPCYSSCLSCNGSSPSSCLSCIPHATITGSNFCPCDQGYFLVQVPPSCSPCDLTCLDCEGSAGTQCVSCSSANATLGNGYCRCNSGYFPNPTSAICTQCHISCLTCTGGGISMCSTCYIKSSLSGSVPSACLCLEGFYPNPSSNNCQPCHATCLTCAGPLNSQCLTCSAPFIFSSGLCTCPASSTPTDCINCHSTCQICTGAGAAMCTGCKANALLQSSQPSNCVCGNGYLPSPGSDNCLACDVSCFKCYSPAAAADCSQCYPNASLEGGSAPSTCRCNSGYFPDPDIAHCSACHSSCYKCTGTANTECSLCYPNAEISSGTCVCYPMYFPSPSVTNCKPCHYTCLTCTGTSLNDCASCFSNATNQSSTCNCNSHYYPNPASNNCSICAEICQTCDSGSTSNCRSCYSGAGMPIGARRSQCSCLLHYYTLSNAAHCLPCDRSCYSCWNGDVPDCYSCYPNASLTNGSKSACACNLYYFPNIHAGACASCHYSCFTCTGASATSCTDCDPNATLSAGVCTCITGYYMTSNGPICYLCNISCISCSNGSSCNTCYSNAVPTASGGNKYCKCVLGYYPEPNPVNCQLCHPTCKGCTGPLATNCSQCFSCEHLGAGNSCDCNTSCFRISSTDNCEPCHSFCYECSGGNGEINCTNCYSNAALVGPSPNRCLCNVRYYPSPSPSTCLQCDNLCLTCSGPSLCTLCDQHSSLQPPPSSGTCSCDQYYFFQSSSVACVRCHFSCLSCNSQLATACLTCGNNASATSSPGVCLCLNGYYMGNTSPNCFPCDPICSLCASSGSFSCLACKGTAVLTTSPGPSPCFCANNYNLNPITGQCDYCALSCYSCSSPSASACTACWPPAILVPQEGPGYCLCDIGYFPAPTSRLCSPCHRTCRYCLTNSPFSCLDCYNFALLSGTACICVQNAYPDSDSSSCHLCHITCFSCIGPYFNSCTSCSYAGYLQSPAPSLCLCSPGFFPDPDASQCSPCMTICETCLDAVTCSSCRQNAELNEGLICECVLRTMGLPDASNCVLCPKGCKSCFEIGCLECISGYYLLQYECYEKCPIGYEAALHSYCAVADMSPPVANLTVFPGNVLAVSFDKPMNFTISAVDFTIEVLTPSGDLSPITWTEPEFQTADNFTLSLQFQASYLPPYSQANFTFLSPAQVLSAQLVPIASLWLSASLYSFGIQPANRTTTLQDGALARNTAAAAKGVVAATVVNSMISGGPGSFMSLINQLQLITYLSMSNLPIAVDFAGTLAAINVGNMLPNPLSEYINMNITVEKAISPPDNIANYGIETTLFLSNACTFLVVTSLIMLSYIPTHFLSKSANKSISLYCQKRMKSLTFSTPLLTFLTSYLDLCLFSLIQIAQMRESLISPYAWISMLFACLFVVITWITPIALVIFTLVYRAKMTSRADSQFNERWGELYMAFTQSNKVAIIAFYSLFVVRRLLLVVTLILFPSFISLFAILNSSVSLLFVLYLLSTHPYTKSFDHAEAVTIEAGTALVYFLAGAFALPLSSTIKSVLDQLGTWSVRAVIAVNFLFSLWRSVAAIAGVIKAYKMRVNQAKYERYETRSSARAREVFEMPRSVENRGRFWW